MAVLVTGGAGYIGSIVTEHLIAAGDEVVVLDNLSTGFRSAVTSGTLVVGDTGDRDVVSRLLAEYGVETILHFAAHTIVPESVSNPLKYYGNNTCATRNLIECAAGAGIRHFIFSSTSGPGSLHPALWISLAVGLGIGILAQRTRMCFAGGWRDLILIKDIHLFSLIAAFFVAALVTNFALGQVGHWGFSGQPISHEEHLWNFLGMVLVGLSATLLGGCPLRQMVLSGQGDTDAVMTVLGMVAGAAVAHNFGLASSPSPVGTTTFGAWAVGVGLAIALLIGFLMRERRQA